MDSGFGHTLTPVLYALWAATPRLPSGPLTSRKLRVAAHRPSTFA